MGCTVSKRKHTITHEQENFTRFCKALLGIGTNILQEILEKYIPSNDIAIKVTSASQPYLWGRLNPQQRLLIGQAATDGYKDFDITLCYTLLRNLNVRAPFPKPTRGWGKQPLATDTTQSDDIERIRILRNEMFGHRANPSIPIVEFTDIWNQLRDVCTRMKARLPKGTDFLKELSTLESCHISSVQWDSIVKLVKQLREKSNQIDAHDTQLDEHNRQLATLDKEVDRHDTRLDEHSTQLATLDTEVDRHDTQLDEHNSQLATLDKEVDRHDTQLDEHSTTLATLDKEVDRHDTQLDEHNSHLATLEKEADRHDTQLDDYSTHLATLDKEVDRHDTQLDEHNTHLATLDTEVDRHDTQLDEYSTQLATLDTEVDRHDTQLDEHSTQLATLDKEVDRHDTQLGEHNTHLATLDTGVQSHGTQLDEHKRHLDSLDESCQNHETQIANIKERLESDQHNPGDEQSIKNLRERLIKINNDKTRIIPLSPLLERGEDELPIEQLYAQVIIQEDPKYKGKGHDASHSKKVITDSDDIFTKDGEIVKKIYMIGDAGRGKTTFCLWLLKNWCNALQKDGSESEELDKWEKKLKEFDFVFLLQLFSFQNYQTNRASVVDMICHVEFESDTDHHATIHYVLSSNKYKSLIIIDGIEEWNPNEETRQYLRCDRMPILDVSSTVSCFIAMRPWLLSTMSTIVANSDKVIEIFGLNEAGVENVIKNVLFNRYQLKEYPNKCMDECNKIVAYFSEKRLKSVMQIPLLTVVCVQMLYEKKQIWHSLTSFYCEMVNMLIERTSEKHTRIQLKSDNTFDYENPENLLKHKAIKNCFSIILQLGKIAYDGLLYNRINFQKLELEKQISERNLQFALRVGLISLKEANCRTRRNVSIHFFHKSMQEFLAVIYIVTNRQKVGDSFCKHLSSVEVIMELSNVIMFICGMCPSFGSVISQHVVSVTDSDKNICQYRESPFEGNSTVEELYKLQVSWYREFQDGQTERPVTDWPVTDRLLTDRRLTFHVSDVYLWIDSDKEIVRMTRKLLCDQHVNIRSLYLLFVPYGDLHGIPETVVRDFLCNKHNNTRSLDMVYVSKGYSLSRICIPSLKTLYLGNVETGNSEELLKTLTSLHKLVLWDMYLRGLNLYKMTSLLELRLTGLKFGDKGLKLSYHIRWVRLKRVIMASDEWQQFISSALDIQNTVELIVELYDTNIDVASLKRIRLSHHSKVTQVSGERKHGKYSSFVFRVLPMRYLHSSSSSSSEEMEEEEKRRRRWERRRMERRSMWELTRRRWEKEVGGDVGALEEEGDEEVRGDVGALEEEVDGDVGALEEEVGGDVGALEEEGDEEVRGDVGALEEEVGGDVGALEEEGDGEVRGDVGAREEEEKEEVGGDVGALEEEVGGDVGALEEEGDEEVRGDMGALEEEVGGDVGALEEEVGGDVGALEEEGEEEVGALEEEEGEEEMEEKDKL